MSRHLLFVLLLVTSVALADNQPEVKHDPGATEAQAKTEAAQGRTEYAQAGVGQRPYQLLLSSLGPTKEGAQLTPVPGGSALGMSVLGNQEAPKSLVLVPWKSSQLGDSLLGISPMLDDSRQPVDREVFLRALRYYKIRSEKKP